MIRIVFLVYIFVLSAFGEVTSIQNKRAVDLLSLYADINTTRLEQKILITSHDIGDVFVMVNCGVLGDESLVCMEDNSTFLDINDLNQTDENLTYYMDFSGIKLSDENLTFDQFEAIRLFKNDIVVIENNSTISLPIVGGKLSFFGVKSAITKSINRSNLSAAAPSAGRVRYNYKIENSNSDFSLMNADTLKLLSAALISAAGDYTCAEKNSKTLLRGGVGVEFNYYLENGQKLLNFTIDKSYCTNFDAKFKELTK